jgi:hypothetical protein
MQSNEHEQLKKKKLVFKNSGTSWKKKISKGNFMNQVLVSIKNTTPNPKGSPWMNNLFGPL